MESNAAIHIASSISELTTARAISDYLRLPIEMTERILERLRDFGLVRNENRRWQYLGADSLHLGDDSPLTRMNHLNWRILAMNKPFVSERDIHYSSVFAIDRQDISKLREQILTFIERQELKMYFVFAVIGFPKKRINSFWQMVELQMFWYWFRF